MLSQEHPPVRSRLGVIRRDALVRDGAGRPARQFGGSRTHHLGFHRAACVPLHHELHRSSQAGRGVILGGIEAPISSVSGSSLDSTSSLYDHEFPRNPEEL